MATGNKPTPGNTSAEGQFDELLSLVLARSRGEVGNDAVEDALSSIIVSSQPSTAAGGGGAPSARNKDNIIPDEGNYDASDEDEVAKKETPKDNAKNSSTKVATALDRKSCSQRQKAIENIPLGKMGERMLITFGDGPAPNIDVISSTLLGTRKSLQRAILDARALRR